MQRCTHRKGISYQRSWNDYKHSSKLNWRHIFFQSSNTSIDIHENVEIWQDIDCSATYFFLALMPLLFLALWLTDLLGPTWYPITVPPYTYNIKYTFDFCGNIFLLVHCLHLLTNKLRNIRRKIQKTIHQT